MGEGIHDGGTLDVGSNDYCVLAQVQEERVAGPTTDGFDDVERYSPQQVFQGGMNPDAVALEGFQA